MAGVEIDQLYQQAVEHHRAGRVSEAQSIYREVVARNSKHSDALNSLGILAQSAGHGPEAIDLISEAIAINPNEPGYHANLGIILAGLHRIPESIKAFEVATRLDPRNFESTLNLGAALMEDGQHARAITVYQSAIEIRPDSPEAYFNFANALVAAGKGDEAIEAYRRALELRPQFPDAAVNLGFALHAQGNLEEAVASWRNAIALGARNAQLQFALGTVLRDGGATAEAISHFRQALADSPSLAEAENNLGLSHRDAGQMDEAIAAYHRAIAIRPQFAEAWNNLGVALLDVGRFDESLDALRRAVALNAPPQARSNLLYSQLFNPAFDAESIVSEHKRWNDELIRPSAGSRDASSREPIDLNPDRRLKIGYISPNFRNHVVGRFMLPLCRHHNHREVEVFFYDDCKAPDSVTRQLQTCADVWRAASGLLDEQLAERITRDRIDILVDLNMHMEASRLHVFVHRPAPIQVTYLAYAGTTGLAEMDYRLTDPYLDPPGFDPALYTERSIHLPKSYWCYPAPDEAPEPGPLPASRNQYVTFGCLNNFSKLNRAVVELWSAILRRTPRSRLLLHASHGSHRQDVLRQFERQGILPDRIAFAPRALGRDYFSLYCRIDIALDPFPYPGGTTTCDALWMGVPVVSLVGRGAISRAGASLLTNVGLASLIASTPAQYFQLATALGSDLPRLESLRAGLRQMMRSSPLMDCQRFAGDVEAAYRRMWIQYVVDGGPQNRKRAGAGPDSTSSPSSDPDGP